MVLKPLRRLPPRRLHEAPARAQGRGEGTAPARRRASAEGGLCPKLPGASQRRISLRKGIATGRSHFSRLTLPLTIKLDLEPGWAKPCFTLLTSVIDFAPFCGSRGRASVSRAAGLCELVGSSPRARHFLRRRPRKARARRCGVVAREFRCRECA
jgi:hypothetical protein